MNIECKHFAAFQCDKVVFFFITATAYFLTRQGGAVAQSVERATPDEEIPGSIPAVAARSPLVGSVSV